MAEEKIEDLLFSGTGADFESDEDETTAEDIEGTKEAEEEAEIEDGAETEEEVETEDEEETEEGAEVPPEIDLTEHDRTVGEYDETFTGAEKMQQQFLSIKSKIHIMSNVEIPIESINVSLWKQKSRKDTLTGFTGVVQALGIVRPITVLKLHDEDAYALLDGFCVLYAAARNGYKTIKADIWKFSDIDEGKENAIFLAFYLNRRQKHSNLETWYNQQALTNASASPALIEYLLQLNSGESTKLQDIMTNDVPAFADAYDKFIKDELTIDQAYKKLQTARKKMDKEGLEDKTVIVKGTDESTMTTDVKELEGVLDDATVRDLLDIVDEGDEETADISELDRSQELEKPEVQKKDDRHPVDPAIKKAVFIRDKFTCQCCGLKGQANNGVLVFHHIVGVACGGPDTVDNGLTLCQNCHMLLHMYVFGDVHISWEDYKPIDIDKALEEETVDEEYPEETQTERRQRLERLNIERQAEEKKFRKVCKYGNVQIEAWKKMGKTRKEVKKEDKDSVRHLRPGEGLKDIKDAYRSYTAGTTSAGTEE